jgi:hypothetical protein
MRKWQPEFKVALANRDPPSSLRHSAQYAEFIIGRAFPRAVVPSLQAGRNPVRCPTAVVIKAEPELDRLSHIIRGFNDRWPERLVPAGLGLDTGPSSQERLISNNIDQALSQPPLDVSVSSKS